MHDDPSTWSTGRLLSTVARKVEHDWNAWLDSHDVTHAGLIVLQALADGPLTQRQLAAISRVEEQTMSRVLERLERTGYVTRERDPLDRRRHVVRRTTAGQDAYDRVEASGVATRLVEDHLEDSTRFRAELLRVLHGLTTR